MGNGVLDGNGCSIISKIMQEMLLKHMLILLDSALRYIQTISVHHKPLYLRICRENSSRGWTVQRSYMNVHFKPTRFFFRSIILQIFYTTTLHNLNKVTLILKIFH